MSIVKLAFERQAVRVPIDSILPLRTVTENVRTSQKYRRIEASVREMGVIEPLVVHPQKPARGEAKKYLLLDGHLRLEVLKALGKTDVLCLVSTDDEAFTYNHKVNQLSPIQEHFMILRALDGGASEERAANVLSLDIATIRKKRDLLDGICGEAVELLKSHKATPGTIRELRRVKPLRQIEMADVMVAAHNFSVAYAKCLVAATAQEQLVQPEPSKGLSGMRPEDIARIERETQSIEADFRTIEDSHGRNMLNLVLSAGYVRRLLDNAAVVKYLSRKHGDLLAELERVVESANVGESAASPIEGTAPSDAASPPRY